MSRRIDFSLASHGQPWTSTAADWEQTAFNEQDAAAIITQIGANYNPSTIYILYGCVLTSSAGTTTVTAGWLFTNGVFVKMNAASYADPSGGNVSIVNYVDTYGDGAGTTFADSTVANVLLNRNAVCLAGASGTGTAGNYVDLIPIQFNLNYSLTTLDGKTFYFARDSHNEFRYAGALSGTVSFTLDFTSAKQGAVVTIYTPITSSPTITVNDGGSALPCYLSAPTTLSGKSNLVYRFTYMGVRSGVHYYMSESYAY